MYNPRYATPTAALTISIFFLFRQHVTNACYFETSKRSASECFHYFVHSYLSTVITWRSYQKEVVFWRFIQTDKRQSCEYMKSILFLENFRQSCFFNVDSVISAAEIHFFVVSEEKRESDLIRCENEFRIEFFREDGTVLPATGWNFFHRHQRTC